MSLKKHILLSLEAQIQSKKKGIVILMKEIFTCLGKGATTERLKKQRHRGTKQRKKSPRGIKRGCYLQER